MGAGISGLAAAYFYRKSAGSKARILVLDNHDDFGGHARRNEFRVGHRTLLAHGGTPLFDPEWREEDKPWVVGRQAFGRITIANSDAAAEAETDAAIDEAHRAVHEILKEA